MGCLTPIVVLFIVFMIIALVLLIYTVSKGYAEGHSTAINANGAIAVFMGGIIYLSYTLYRILT